MARVESKRKISDVVVYVVIVVVMCLAFLGRSVALQATTQTDSDDYSIMTLTNNNDSSSSSPSSLTVMNTFKYPMIECLNLMPVNQFYHPFLFTVDSDFYNYCDLGGVGPRKVPTELGNYLPNFSCVDLLCQRDTVWNLMNKTQAIALGVLVNHCLHCNNSQAELFRKSLYNNSCPSFSILDRVNHNVTIVSSSQLIPKLVQVSHYHCNHVLVSGSTTNVASQHLPLFNHNILTSPFSKRTIAEFLRKYLNLTTEAKDEEILKAVSLPMLFTYYFTDLFSMSTNEWPSPPLNIPITCRCDFKSSQFSESGKTESGFGFQCGDFYHGWQVMFAYQISVVLFSVLYAVVTVLLVFVIVIPRLVERVDSFKKRSDIVLGANLCLKILKAIRHYFDIVTQPSLFMTLSAICGFLENILRFTFNFSSFYPVFDAYFPGIFRGLACVFMICGYSSLVICWSHAIDLSKRKASESNNLGLSKLNIIILSIFYALVIVVGIVCVIIYLIVKNYSIAWIVMCCAVIIYLLTFVFGFTFYGVKILIALKSASSEKKNIMEYRFTKFMLLVTCVFLIGWLIALGMIITYVWGYDILSLFFGLARNQFMDAGLSAVIILSSYITFSVPAFEMTYGKIWNRIKQCSSSMNNCTSNQP